MTSREIKWKALLQRQHLFSPKTARYILDLIRNPRSEEKADEALNAISAELEQMREKATKWPEVWASDRVTIRLGREGEWVIACLVDEPTGEILDRATCGRTGEYVSERIDMLKMRYSAMKLAHQVWNENEVPF